MARVPFGRSSTQGQGVKPLPLDHVKQEDFRLDAHRDGFHGREDRPRLGAAVQRDEDAPQPVGSNGVSPAHEEHRFTSITEDLALLVIFGPAEESRAS